MRFLHSICLTSLCLVLASGCGGPGDVAEGDGGADAAVQPASVAQNDAPAAQPGAQPEVKPATPAGDDATKTAKPPAAAANQHPELDYITADMGVAVRIQGKQIQSHPLVKMFLKELPSSNDKMTQVVLNSEIAVIMLSKTPPADPDGPPASFVFATRIGDQALFREMEQGMRGDPSLPEMPEGLDERQLYEKFNKEFREWEAAGSDPTTAPEFKRYRPRAINYKGKSMLVQQNAVSAMFPGDNWVVAGPTETLKQTIDGSNRGTELIAKLTALGLDNDLVAVGDLAAMQKVITPLRPMVEQQLGPASAPASTAIDNVQSFQLTIDLDSDKIIDLQITAADADGAKELTDMVTGFKALALPGLKAGAEAMANPEATAPVIQLATGLLSGVTIKSEGAKGSLVLNKPADFDQWPKKLQPVVESMRAAARRANRMNNMKQILLAFHNYHDTFGKFPANAIYSKDGKALSSWRVSILPFIEQSNLYDVYAKNKSWNSPENARFASYHIGVYAAAPVAEGQSEKLDVDAADTAKKGSKEDSEIGAPEVAKEAPAVAVPPVEGKVPANAVKTRYQLFVGPGAIFETNKGIRFSSITDGTSNTILLIETGPEKAVPWSQPADLPFEKDTDLFKAIGQPTDGVYLVGLADGSVHSLTPDQLKDKLRQLITRNGQEIIELP